MKEEVKKLLQEMDRHLKETKERLNKLREIMDSSIISPTISHSLVEKENQL